MRSIAAAIRRVMTRIRWVFQPPPLIEMTDGRVLVGGLCEMPPGAAIAVGLDGCLHIENVVFNVSHSIGVRMPAKPPQEGVFR